MSEVKTNWYMKTVYSIILISCITLGLSGCKKDKDNDTPDDLIGAWELAETSAAMMPGVTDYAPGNGNVISFKDDKYFRYNKGQLVTEGTYTVVEDHTVEEHVCLVDLHDKFTHRIIFDNNYSAPKTFLYINDAKLSLISGCYALDAGTKKVYRRIYNIDGSPGN
jgi:hypothetical protein